jgi:hypothetical protein
MSRLSIVTCFMMSGVGPPCCIGADAAPASSQPAPGVTGGDGIAGPGTIHLFSGKNLDGFYTFLQGRGRNSDPRHVFTVVDGLLRVSGEEWGCITTNEEYENYILIAEYKWGQKTWPPRLDNARDNGLMLHSIGKDGAFDGAWMSSIECQIIEGGTGDLIVVGDGSDRFSLTAPVAKKKSAGCYVYDPLGEPATMLGGRLNWFGRDPAWQDVKGVRGKRDLEKPIGEWNELVCFVAGDEILVRLNGVVVNACRQVRPHKGRIQVQSEGAECFFRRLDLKPLDDPRSGITTRPSSSTHASGKRK